MRHDIIEAAGAMLRPTSPRDLEILRGFFDDPGFHEQWGGRPLTEDEILEKYTGRRAPSVECFIVEEGRTPVGFVQYHVASDGVSGGGLDLVLSPDVRGRGLGFAVVHALVDHLLGQRGWRRITVDPDVANTRGVNFWHKVGFETEHLVENDPHRAPYWSMAWPIARPPESVDPKR